MLAAFCYRGDRQATAAGESYGRGLRFWRGRCGQRRRSTSELKQLLPLEFGRPLRARERSRDGLARSHPFEPRWLERLLADMTDRPARSTEREDLAAVDARSIVATDRCDTRNLLVIAS